MPIRIDHHHRVVVRIRIPVLCQDVIGIAWVWVHGQEHAMGWVVVSGNQVVEPGLFVILVSRVAIRVSSAISPDLKEAGPMCRTRNERPRFLAHRLRR